ncbi:MAG: hypothetical protein JWN38_649 [Candidatus Saccharibacteria bacterium]|nr:hypothetical protein [Candidatus Saccharibacteria bacterium]
MTPATATDAYIPGVCNINREEIAKRRLIGHIGLAAFIIILALLLITGVDRYLRIILFIPAMLSISGYLQARNHFCVGYGGSGKQNAGEGSATASTVEDADALAKDKQRTRKMNLQTLASAIVVTLITLLLPVFN